MQYYHRPSRYDAITYAKTNSSLSNAEEVIKWLRDFGYRASWSPAYETPDGQTGSGEFILVTGLEFGDQGVHLAPGTVVVREDIVGNKLERAKLEMMDELMFISLFEPVKKKS